MVSIYIYTCPNRQALLQHAVAGPYIFINLTYLFDSLQNGGLTDPT